MILRELTKINAFLYVEELVIYDYKSKDYKIEKFSFCNSLANYGNYLIDRIEPYIVYSINEEKNTEFKLSSSLRIYIYKNLEVK